jgi:hypothetical protein
VDVGGGATKEIAKVGAIASFEAAPRTSSTPMRKVFPCASTTSGAPYRRAHRAIASLAIVSLTLEATWLAR